jgi:hypothetical protein
MYTDLFKKNEGVETRVYLLTRTKSGGVLAEHIEDESDSRLYFNHAFGVIAVDSCKFSGKKVDGVGQMVILKPRVAELMNADACFTFLAAHNERHNLMASVNSDLVEDYAIYIADCRKNGPRAIEGETFELVSSVAVEYVRELLSAISPDLKAREDVDAEGWREDILALLIAAANSGGKQSIAEFREELLNIAYDSAGMCERDSSQVLVS